MSAAAATKPWFRVAFAACLALGAGCSELDEWKAVGGQIYRGPVVGAEGDVFIRHSFAAGTMLEMRYDPTDALAPGALRTLDADCDGAATFADVPLEPVAALAHDELGLYDFPGASRVRNFVYVARPTTGPLAGRDATVFVSLVKDQTLEVRIIAGSARDPARECGASAVQPCEQLRAHGCDYFGLFRLKRGPAS